MQSAVGTVAAEVRLSVVVVASSGVAVAAAMGLVRQLVVKAVELRFVVPIAAAVV